MPPLSLVTSPSTDARSRADAASIGDRAPLQRHDPQGCARRAEGVSNLAVQFARELGAGLGHERKMTGEAASRFFRSLRDVGDRLEKIGPRSGDREKAVGGFEQRFRVGREIHPAIRALPNVMNAMLRRRRQCGQLAESCRQGRAGDSGKAPASPGCRQRAGTRARAAARARRESLRARRRSHAP